MSIPRCALAATTVVCLACGDEPATPEVGAPLEGRYTLAWTADRAAPAITIVPGVALMFDECGNGAQPPNASFTFADSSALLLQGAPQAYALTLVGTITDCDGARTRFFDVAAGDYLRVDDTWLVLAGDPAHPHMDGHVTADPGAPLTIVLRPGQPGLATPLAGLDRLCFMAP